MKGCSGEVLRLVRAVRYAGDLQLIVASAALSQSQAQQCIVEASKPRSGKLLDSVPADISLECPPPGHDDLCVEPKHITVTGCEKFESVSFGLRRDQVMAIYITQACNIRRFEHPDADGNDLLQSHG